MSYAQNCSLGAAMTDKPRIDTEYREDDLTVVRAGCLYLATKIGDIMEDIVVVGGLVPSLLIDQAGMLEGESSSSPFQEHVGTKDLDLGLDLAILGEKRYLELGLRLRGADFTPDTNSQGNLTRQRWRLQAAKSLTVDFLIQPTEENDRGGTLLDIESDFAAVVTPGLHLAFVDRRQIPLAGYTTMGEWAERDIWVCGPGAFLVLKAIAFRNRGENKDAYDLVYMLRSAMFEPTLRNDLLSFLSDHRRDADVQRALSYIEQDFISHDGVGPKRTSAFWAGQPDDEIQADVVSLVSRLLKSVSVA